MKLSRLQSVRLFKLFDPLTAYANACLDVVDVDELFTDDARGMSDVAQAHVAHELWQNLDVFDRYIADNPDGLTAGELDVMRRWRNGLSGYFVVARFPDGVVRFMRGGYAFEVCGISREIEDMVGELPATVSTTLLPFDDRIVFAEYLSIMQVRMGANMLASLDDEVANVMESGMCVSSADGLLNAAAIIRENEIERETEELMDDLEQEALLAQPSAGQHRGVLAGLDDAERERRIREQSDRDWSESSYSPFTWLEEHCLEGPVTKSLIELVERQGSDFAEELAGGLRDVMVAEYKVELADATIRAYVDAIAAGDETFDTHAAINEREARADDYREELNSWDDEKVIVDYYSDAAHLQEAIEKRGSRQIEALRDLCERGGYLRVRKDSLERPAGLPYPVFGICSAFFDGETFEFVVPDEVIGTLREVDWDGCLDYDEKRRNLIMFFDVLVELRGIVPLGQALSEYLEFYPDAFDEEEAYDVLVDAIEREECGAHVLDAKGEEFLLHYELIWGWRRSRGLDPYDGGWLDEGPLGSMLENLLAMQKDKEPRPVEPAMLEDEFGLFSWKEKQPACRKMRDFLDEHVPDERSDYYFADKVLEELIDEAKWGIDNESVETLFGILEDNDFIPEQHQVQPLLTMWMNIGNSLPIWPNNGWAPNDLLARDLGRPVFFNEDGSVKKVGRNDPCPCGSGKKYKKCCGR